MLTASLAVIVQTSMTSAPRASRRRILVAAVGATAFAFVALQLVRPIPSNPPVLADLGARADVEEILRASCYDCHSNETRLRWFDEIAPVSFLVARDVANGRQHLNFSELGRANEGRQRVVLFESINQIKLGAMPPRAYTRVHPGAAVSDAALDVLKRYVQPDAAGRLPAPAWPAEAAPPVSDEIRPSPNGLNFVRGYATWRVMTSSDRFDNGTMRVILANEIAARAIDEGRIAPWPDRSAFAKVLWVAAKDGQGALRPGAFRQIDFMVKGARQFGATLGWGWSRWVGPTLTPYGDSAHFDTECMGCHAPMHGNDYVFTMPIRDQETQDDRFNRDAALAPGLSYRPLDARVVTTMVDPSRGTTSMVLGNALAVEHAHGAAPGLPPPGSMVARVTWAQRENPHWFGARIPGLVQSAEIVEVGASSPTSSATTYEIYQGRPLRKIELSVEERATRQAALLGERAAAMPGGDASSARN